MTNLAKKVAKAIRVKNMTTKPSKIGRKGSWGRRLLARTPIDDSGYRNHEYHATKGWRDYRKKS